MRFSAFYKLVETSNILLYRLFSSVITLLYILVDKSTRELSTFVIYVYKRCPPFYDNALVSEEAALDEFHVRYEEECI
jgi:hypothetical protein